MELETVDWPLVEKALKTSMGGRAKVVAMGEHKKAVTFNGRACAILFDLSDMNNRILGCSLRASIRPNDAASLVATLAIEMMVLIDENFEFSREGETLTGEASLEYVFGQFYERKQQEAIERLNNAVSSKMPN